jgi:aminoglycoside phosphotransferase (APT) family kinase protein
MNMSDNNVARPSDDWSGTLRHPKAVGIAIQQFVSSLDREAFCRHANSIRGRTDCKIRTEKFECGKDHVLFELSFDDNVIWLARVPRPVDSSGVNSGPEEMESEIATMNFVRQHSTIPVPEIYGYDLDKTNAVGAPYILMSALPGRIVVQLPLVEKNFRAHVYRQVASIMIQLSRLPRWSRIGFIRQSETTFSISNMLIPVANQTPQSSITSTRSFFNLRAQCFLDRRLAEGNVDKITIAWLYRKAIKHFLNQETNDQFFLCHADFSNCNILYDDNYNITGVIDWTWAQAVPWELFAILPHEFSTRFPPEWSMDGDSRALFLTILKEEESKLDGTTPLAKFIGSTASMLVELTQNYMHMEHGSWVPMDSVRELIELMYGKDLGWEDVKRMAKTDLGK